jgi:hypothetical protein
VDSGALLLYFPSSGIGGQRPRTSNNQVHA